MGMAVELGQRAQPRPYYGVGWEPAIRADGGAIRKFGWKLQGGYFGRSDCGAFARKGCIGS